MQKKKDSAKASAAKKAKKKAARGLFGTSGEKTQIDSLARFTEESTRERQ
jgi:hypothetical protein